MYRLKAYLRQPIHLLFTYVVILQLLYGNVANADSNALAGYWKLDEALGRIAYDSSGNTNHGEIFGGVTWAPYEGKFEGAALFNGRTFCRIQIPMPDISPTTTTISFWAYLSEPQNLAYPLGGQYRFFFCNDRRIRIDKSESANKRYSWLGRIQLFMDKGDTGLDLGLGDAHRRHRNITSLEIGRWYHLVLTCDQGVYTVYINGIQKATGKYTGFPVFPQYINIGNGRSYEQAFFGLIDDFAVFRYALSQNEVAQLYLSSVEAFVQEPASHPSSGGIQKAGRLLETRKPRGAIAVLTKEIARLLQQVEHTPATEFRKTLKQVLSNSTNKQYVLASVARQIEFNDNWPLFEAFAMAVFAEIENASDAARWIEFGLDEQGPWKKKYLELCRGTANSAAYAFGNDCNSADTYAAEGNYKEAIKLYEGLMQLYDSADFRSQLAIKICKCLLRAGEYKSAIGELERLLANSDRLSDFVTKEATIIKTYCHIRSAATDKALSDLRRLAQNEPTPEVSLLLGYCYSLEEDYARATEILNGVLRDCPDSSYAIKAQMCIDHIDYMSD